MKEIVRGQLAMPEHATRPTVERQRGVRVEVRPRAALRVRVGLGAGPGCGIARRPIRGAGSGVDRRRVPQAAATVDLLVAPEAALHGPEAPHNAAVVLAQPVDPAAGAG